MTRARQVRAGGGSPPSIASAMRAYRRDDIVGSELVALDQDMAAAASDGTVTLDASTRARLLKAIGRADSVPHNDQSIARAYLAQNRKNSK